MRQTAAAAALGAFAIRLLFRHCVHTRTRFGAPSTSTRTVCRFGYQRRLVRLLAWLTLLPVVGPLPHTVQTRAISSIFRFVRLSFSPAITVAGSP
jgi:hypothetical protein